MGCSQFVLPNLKILQLNGNTHFENVLPHLYKWTIESYVKTNPLCLKAQIWLNTFLTWKFNDLIVTLFIHTIQACHQYNYKAVRTLLRYYVSQ